MKLTWAGGGAADKAVPSVRRTSGGSLLVNRLRCRTPSFRPCLFIGRLIPLRFALSSFLLIGVGLAGLAQSFQNLDFEQASLIPNSGDPYDRVQFGPALPGWIGYCGSAPQASVNYNSLFLDSAGISILDTNYQNQFGWADFHVELLTHGRFCVLLQSGFSFGSPPPGPPVATSIVQAGRVPTDAKSIVLNASSGGIELSFNGSSIPLAVLTEVTNNVALLGGDVSKFSGQTGELRFTAPLACWYDEHGQLSGCAGWVYILDHIRFSTSPPAIWPAILTQPQSQTAETGARVRLAARATGDLPLDYLWIFNHTNILSVGSNSVLEIENVEASRAGPYTVVVTNAGGAVTSTPAMLGVIPPVERRWVPAIILQSQPYATINLETTSTFAPTSNWAAFGSLLLTKKSQWYFDLSAPLPQQRFYRAWQTNALSRASTLDLHMVPAISLSGSIGSSVRLDYINQFGSTDAWITLATVLLTENPQLYFDTSAIGQPPRLWRIVPVP